MVPTFISLFIPCSSLVLYGVFAHMSSANKQVKLEKSTVRVMLDRDWFHLSIKLFDELEYMRFAERVIYQKDIQTCKT